MKLALALGHVTSAGDVARRIAQAREAEQLGYASVWASEAYGSDAVTLLAHVAALTERIEIGSAVLQIPARTPAMTAMTAATLDLVSQCRLRLGLGVSGAQVSEGWHGVPFTEPLQRTREYVSIVRAALRRDRLTASGPHYPLPLPGGAGKALKLSLRPVREQLPILLAAVGPASMRLAGEIADGWLSSFLSAEHAPRQLESIRAGRAVAGRTLAGFEILANAPVMIGDDLRACADQVRAHVALYIGGMGSRKQNFYNKLAVAMGFEEAARAVQELFLGGDPAAAAAAVPFELIDQVSLLGPVPRVADRIQALAEVGVTTLAVGSTGGTELTPTTLRDVAEAFEKAGVCD